MHHSEQRQWPTARKQRPDPRVSMHPDTAVALGIADGDWVQVATDQGTIRQRAHYTERIPPGLADSEHGWWFPERIGSPDAPGDALTANANVLCSDAPAHCAPGLGSWAQTGLPCRITKEKAP